MCDHFGCGNKFKQKSCLSLISVFDGNMNLNLACEFQPSSVFPTLSKEKRLWLLSLLKTTAQ